MESWKLEWGTRLDPDEAGVSESSSQVQTALKPLPPEEINPALPDEIVMASPEGAALKNMADSPRTCPHHSSLLLDP